MKTTSAKNKWARFAVLSALLILVLVAIAPLQTTFADEPEGIDVIVTNDGKKFQANVADVAFSHPYAGTGAQTFNESEATPGNGQVMQFGNQTETVIVPDGRSQVTKTSKYPNRAIASLVMTYPYGDFICTGWFIGPDTLATAGHCVFDPSTLQFPTKIMVYPGRDGNNLPYGSAQSIQLFTNNCWTSTQNPKCDYGGIKINKTLGNTVGWFGFGWTNDNNQLLNHKVHVRGYPGDKPSGTMWNMKGPLQVITKKQVGYSIDTFGGQSGSPVFGNMVFGAFPCNPCGAGIHAYGFDQFNPRPPFYSRNSGTRITPKVFNALCNYRGGCS
ncbi:MAG: trypsin-like serine protease [Anaerolineae bacterium]|nr:trypsin-like serine protease [Anaerolineae bacterium]